jgi:Reverse transcriptase (RNA-dependent DNA polymerase)
MGDVSAVAPLTAAAAAQVGVSEGNKLSGRVQSFTEKQMLINFRQQDWAGKEIQEVYAFLQRVKKSPVREPQGPRAMQLSETAAWLSKYPAWFKPFVAGQLFACKQVWVRTFAQQQEPVPGRISKWLDEGYSVWLHKGKFGRQPKQKQLSAEELAFATKQAQEWVGMGALEKVSKPPEWVLVCNVVVAYRAGSMDRVCWAGNPINEGIQVDPFRMESLQEVVRMMQVGDWMFSFDLKKGYFQIPLKRKFKEFTYMRIGDQYFRWNVLMFGLSAAPKDFSFVIKKVLGLLRKQGIRCCFYIDDIIFFARSRDAAVQIRQTALDLFYHLGFIVSWQKSLLQPGRLIRHLGLDVCSNDGTVWVPEDKVMRVKQLAGELLQQSAGTVSGRSVAVLIGVLGSLRLAMPATLILTRGLMRTLSQLPILYEQVVENRHREVRDYDGDVRLSPLAIAELRFWVEGCWQLRSAGVKEVAHTVCFVDACPEGAGAVVARKLSGGKGEQWDIEHLRGGAWQERMDDNSTVFELLNIWNVVEEFKKIWGGRLIHICSDNVGAVFITGRGCMKNSCLHALSLAVWRTCWQNDISLCTQYIGGDGIIAAGADGLSRDSDYGDCRLRQAVFARLWEEWHMEVDLFCSPQATQRNPVTGELLWAVSPYFCEKRVGVDGLRFNSTKVLYAFPPSALLRALIPRAVKVGLRVVLIIPVWPEQPWWPLVCHLPTIDLGTVRNCVCAGEAGICHPFGPKFDPAQALDTKLQAKALNL